MKGRQPGRLEYRLTLRPQTRLEDLRAALPGIRWTGLDHGNAYRQDAGTVTLRFDRGGQSHVLKVEYLTEIVNEAPFPVHWQLWAAKQRTIVID